METIKPQSNGAQAVETPEQPSSIERLDEQMGASVQSTSVDAEAMMKRGRIVWLKCRSCHEVDPGAPHKVGPNLHGMFDQPIASREGFTYSAAFEESDIIWTDETLDAFIERPTNYIRGTKMAFAGISKESDRTAVIAYLRKATQ
ncbi:c-type cytochrome [Algimonas porphyrae]|nr:cytochrome c family protein [Algimonas porphyrae]